MTTVVRTFQHPNESIRPGLVDDLYHVMKHTRMWDCYWIMAQLSQDHQAVEHVDYGGVDIETLCKIYGRNRYADGCGPVLFYGGPMLAGDSMFVAMEGTVLTWVMDTVLYEVTKEGIDVFDKLGIPV